MDSSLAMVLLAAIVVVIFVYVANEHTIYVSDYAGYQNITHGIVAQYRHSLSSALTAIIQSTTSEYNAIFTIPLIPWMLVLGESRMAFEIALGVTYLLPFILLLGAIAVELIRARPRAVFWSTVFLALLTPMVWVPTLRGYPDTGGAALLALAVWIYLRDSELKHAWQIPAIGFLVTSSVLFRRHFAYAALAFFGAIALQALIRFALNVRRAPTDTWRDLRTSIIRIGLIALTAALLLLVFGRSFLIRFLTVDYNALYASYTSPPLSTLEWYIATYGWLIVGVAVAGFILGLWSRVVRREAAAFLVLFASLTVFAWLLIARQTGEQYTLSFTPSVVLGLSALVWTLALRLRPATRRIALAGGAVCLLANFIFGLTTLAIPDSSILSTFFAMSEPPFTRGDQAQVAQLVAYLRESARNGEPIYVAASSAIMGKDTLVSAEHALYGWEDAKLNVLQSPEIDSRDFFPLELLLQAQYVLVVDPFQHHLSPEGQRIVQAVYDVFKDNRELAQDFVELPVRFILDEGAVARIYRRVRPTSLPTAVTTLELMQRYVPVRPGSQLDWINLGSAEPMTVTLNRDATYLVNTQLPARGELTPTLLYIGATPGNRVVRGEITFWDQHCAGVVMHVAHVSSSGNLTPMGQMTRQPTDSPEFALAFAQPDSGFLVVTLESIDNQESADRCPLTINHFRVAPA